MTNKKALITGIAGQDGSYLAELLLAEGFEVFGTIRRNSTPENQENRIHHLENHIKTFYADLTDISSMLKILKDVKPTHIFNLAAQSHVRISFETPLYTAQVNGMGALNFFDVIYQVLPQSRVYQASSSEMFGTCIDNDGFQRETTPMMPSSPYGVAKLFAYHGAKIYRDSYNLFIANGILFNHESPRRGSNFVTSKIVKEAVKIKAGASNSLSLGNIDAKRDWGHSKDYVKAMFKIISDDSPNDYVVATGQTRTVREFLSIVFEELKMNWEDFVIFDPKLLRPKEVPVLKGDSSKISESLQWSPEVSFENLVLEMIEYWSDKLNGQ